MVDSEGKWQNLLEKVEKESEKKRLIISNKKTTYGCQQKKRTKAWATNEADTEM